MKDRPKSHNNKDSKSKVSLLELLAVVLTIIGTIAQLIGLGFQILDYFKQPQPPSINIVRTETNTHSDKAEPDEVHKSP